MENEITSAIATEKMAKLNRLIGDIYYSGKSDFYKNIWGKPKSGKIDFSSLPTIGLNHIIKNEFDERLYIKNGLFVKIVYYNNTPFLIAKTKDGIKKENYPGTGGKRPLVFFKNPQESIEKGLWFYGKNILPLVAEDNLEITLMSAGRYEVDSIMGDAESIEEVALKGAKYFDYEKVTHITVIDSGFEENPAGFLKKHFPFSKISLILSLPETGPLGLPCKDGCGEEVFHPSDSAIIEKDEDGYLVATQIIMMPTPIIRYKTQIKIKFAEKICPGGKDFGFLPQN